MVLAPPRKCQCESGRALRGALVGLGLSPKTNQRSGVAPDDRTRGGCARTRLHLPPAVDRYRRRFGERGRRLRRRRLRRLAPGDRLSRSHLSRPPDGAGHSRAEVLRAAVGHPGPGGLRHFFGERPVCAGPAGRLHCERCAGAAPVHGGLHRNGRCGAREDGAGGGGTRAAGGDPAHRPELHGPLRPRGAPGDDERPDPRVRPGGHGLAVRDERGRVRALRDPAGHPLLEGDQLWQRRRPQSRRFLRIPGR